jgi:hypothetical protein
MKQAKNCCLLGTWDLNSRRQATNIVITFSDRKEELWGNLFKKKIAGLERQLAGNQPLVRGDGTIMSPFINLAAILSSDLT